MQKKNNPFPTKLEQFRREAGWSRTQLSSVSTVSARTIEGLEQRQRNISNTAAIIVLKLAKALQLDPWDLIEDDAQ